MLQVLGEKLHHQPLINPYRMRNFSTKQQQFRERKTDIELTRHTRTILKVRTLEL